jgi:hypothetical protein
MRYHVVYWLAILFAGVILADVWRHDDRCADCHARLARAEADFRQVSNVIALSRYARSSARPVPPPGR